jgi:hypothetical protein
VPRRLRSLLVALALGLSASCGEGVHVPPGVATGAIVAALRTTPAPRTVAAYDGLGAWVDAFDVDPAYQRAGGRPPLGPEAVDAMAARGVKTLFLQAARDDARSPGPLMSPGILAEILVRAHQRGMRVVGWYLPKLFDVQVDLAHLDAIAGFEVFGHRFDGIAVDIEWTKDVPDAATRSDQLVALSTELRQRRGGEALGAIVLPPVQLEVVNPSLWPGFPWRRLASSYDVWMPMSYWTFRSSASGYHDGFTYNEESTRRLRTNLGDANARVHAIGGIGDLVTLDEIAAFARSVRETSAVGGSIYDWNTLSSAKQDALRDAFK